MEFGISINSISVAPVHEISNAGNPGSSLMVAIRTAVVYTAKLEQCSVINDLLIVFVLLVMVLSNIYNLLKIYVCGYYAPGISLVGIWRLEPAGSQRSMLVLLL